MLKKSTPSQIIVDVFAKFFSYVRVEGYWTNGFKDPITHIEIVGNTSFKFTNNLPSSVSDQAKGFIIEIYLENEELELSDIIIKFHLNSKKIIEKNALQLCEERRLLYTSSTMENKFKDLLQQNDKIIDIGGRDRSRYDRTKDFKQEVTVFDVAEGNNVDIVGDAHELSTYFPKSHFDAAMSIYVFEHLAMPWKVVLEINKILKTGGLCLIITHQTIGLHDIPWDFHRFSKDCWPILFNKKTGFDILHHGSDTDQFIIPFIYHDAKKDAEKSKGHEYSYVIARKISDAELEWPVPLNSIIDNNYPLNDDGQNI